MTETVTEILSVRVGKTQKTLKQTAEGILYIPTLISSIPRVSSFKVTVSEATEDLYLPLTTLGSLLYAFPSL